MTLGPITVGVERIGIETVADVPARRRQPRPAGLAVQFKPPSGAAIAVDAGFATGGGYLFFDAEAAQYAGRPAAPARGEADRHRDRHPDDAHAGRLAGLLAARHHRAQGFAPIQLGFGFALTGIGGLLGLNRTVNVEALRAAIETGGVELRPVPAGPGPQRAGDRQQPQRVFPPRRAGS